uniref:Enoyl-CoA delta isomerase 1, mitochondrial n=1 Tax=Leptobrachium leishanense TaxID=445787 RepID=A0A8C5MBH5_9ANUR
EHHQWKKRRLSQATSSQGIREGATQGCHLRRHFSNNKILVELDEASGVAIMKLKNPPVNSLSLELLTEFSITIEKLEVDRSCRGVIFLTSAAPKIFSAGLDITEMSVQELWLLLNGSNMVTIAAINGSSPAGGCLMAMCCDFRIMADNPKYTIGLNETQLGIVAPFWLKDTITNILGHRLTEQSLQLGQMYTSALKIGLVDQLVPEDKVQSTAAYFLTDEKMHEDCNTSVVLRTLMFKALRKNSRVLCAFLREECNSVPRILSNLHKIININIYYRISL